MEFSNIKKSVLVVDDQAKNLQVIATVLSGEYNLYIANHPKKALVIAKEKLPDLILLDIMMPDMNGYEVCRVLKSDELTKDIPIIFLTAKTETEDIIEGFNVGGVDYITKPFRKEEVLSRIKTHIDLKISKDIIKMKNEELMQAIAEKDKFFSIIAHDLKGPFTGFIGLSQILADGSSSFEIGEIKDIALTMYKSADILYKLLENLLNWSRLQRGLLQVEIAKTELLPILDSCVMVGKGLASVKEITLINNVTENLVVFIDINMTATVFRNLISNSIKFTNPGGKIEIFSHEDNDDFITIGIRDNGVGMSGKVKESLFKIDVHHSSIGTANERGTGLGLILCKEFIEKQKGRIRVESEEGIGSTFYISLPKKQ